MQNKTIMRCHLIQPECSSTKSLQTINAGEGVEEGSRLTLLVGMYIGATIIENSMGGPQKLKIELTYEPAIPFLGIYLEKTKI